MSGYIGTQPVPQATQTRDSFTCTAGQTSFATGGYTPTFLDVYLNGIFLANGADYTAANGSDVILTVGAAAGDILEVVAYTTFEVLNQSFTGTTTVENLTVGGDVSFGDNDKAIFGAGSDLQIFHTGSYSAIRDVGTGGLFIGGENYVDIGNAGASATYARFHKDAQVDLYHNNSVKLATTSTGVSITGALTLSGTVDGRDVAADGTKLDGIEAGATSDQTAAQLLTAIKTVDGAGSGLDADTLDGFSEATFMRRSANSQLDMNNNDIVGVDQIVHEGDTNTYIGFHAADQFRVVTGGAERLEVNNSQITSTEPIHAPSFHGDGSSLTGVVGPTTLAAVGSYAFARYSASGSGFQTPGSTHAGSNLRYSASERDAGGSLPGTWRVMGYAVYQNRSTVVVRIS